MGNIQVHATNVHGLGASNVVVSFLDAWSKGDDFEKVTVYLPEKGVLSKYNPRVENLKRFKRRLPNSISRFIECIFSRFIFRDKPTIVLGDIPLRGIKNQIVLAHNPCLIYPVVSSLSFYRSLKYRVTRFLFSVNHKYAKKIIVQTGAIAEDMIKSYPRIKDKVIVCPHPPPDWLKGKTRRSGLKTKKIKLLYPSQFIYYKKHDFLISLNTFCVDSKIDMSDLEVWVTLAQKEFKPFESVSFLKNLGVLNKEKMNEYYQEADALVFLSQTESYGLPLIEAMTINLPAIIVDFNYSRWIFEDSAYYFKAYEEQSFLDALSRLKLDLEKGKKVDYKKPLKKITKSWEEVVDIFISGLKN